MILTNLKFPINIINYQDYDIEIDYIADLLRDSYESDYEWDLYLYRQNQIDFFQENIDSELLEKFDNEAWTSFYLNGFDKRSMQYLINQLNESEKQAFENINKKRKRLVSRFIVELETNKFSVRRVDAGGFSQGEALVNSSKQDYRVGTRYFKELPDHLYGNYLESILKNLSKDIQKYSYSKHIKLDIIVHHTVVYSYPGDLASNSPEGIHQDGMDYIISAFVVERKNINGGKSIIYGADSKTKLMEITLQPGQGILQADKNTELWHEVTSCRSSPDQTGYRSTIGFDVSVI